MKIEWHHWIVLILIVFAGIKLYQMNFLGVPAMVAGVVGGVANTASAAVPTAGA